LSVAWKGLITTGTFFVYFTVHQVLNPVAAHSRA